MRPRFQKEPNGFYRYFFSDPSIKAYTSTRLFEARFEEDVPGGRSRIIDALGLDPKDLVGAEQAHQDKIRIVTPQDKGRGALKCQDAFQATDGFITSDPGIALTIRTADCLPIFIVDPKRSVSCLLHGGWKSLRAGIIQKAIRKMKEDFGCEPAGCEAVLGPGLRFEDFEVGNEFQSFFPSFIKKLHFDPIGYVTDLLLEENVSVDNILDTGLSTIKEEHDFYSYRREGRECGRMMNIIWKGQER